MCSYLHYSTLLCIWRCFHVEGISGSRFPAQSLWGARPCCAAASSQPPPPLCCPAAGRSGTSPRCQSFPVRRIRGIDDRLKPFFFFLPSQSSYWLIQLAKSLSAKENHYLRRKTINIKYRGSKISLETLYQTVIELKELKRSQREMGSS